MNLISFRPNLQPQLVDFLYRMQTLRGNHFDRDNPPPDIQDITAAYKIGGGDFWLLIIEQTIIASIAVRIIDSEQRIGEIKRYFVAPAFQRQGIGSQLMAHALDFARDSGLRKVRLDTMKRSESAMIVFKQYGFYEIAKYNQNDVAEIFMECSLAPAIEV